MDQSNQFNKQNNKTYLQHKKERREKKKIAKRATRKEFPKCSTTGHLVGGCNL